MSKRKLVAALVEIDELRDQLSRSQHNYGIAFGRMRAVEQLVESWGEPSKPVPDTSDGSQVLRTLKRLAALERNRK